MTEEAVLGDIRILDLSEDIAGPFCTKLLAGLEPRLSKSSGQARETWPG